jgi:hypothetical protein
MVQLWQHTSDCQVYQVVVQSFIGVQRSISVVVVAVLSTSRLVRMWGLRKVESECFRVACVYLLVSDGGCCVADSPQQTRLVSAVGALAECCIENEQCGLTHLHTFAGTSGVASLRRFSRVCVCVCVLVVMVCSVWID